MIGIDLFSGAGGLSLGAAKAGIDIILSVENDKLSAETYSHNHPNSKVIISDIRNVKIYDLPNPEDQTILFGGPPCQGFSTSNQKNRGADNKSNWLYTEFIRIAKLWKPEWILFENVKGITETANGIFIKSILKEINEIGYTTSHWILNSADYGVPQIRNRLFIIGSLNGIICQKPKPTINEYITVKDALFDLPYLSNGDSYNELPYKCKPISQYANKMRGNLDIVTENHVSRNADYIIERYKYIPQGSNWESIPSHLMKNYKDRNRCHTGIYRRLKNDEPSVVIGNYRKNMLIHPDEDRGLSVREAARLQSFPDWYEFKGSIGYKQQQVGNAVPPLLAKCVFNEIISNNKKRS